MIDSLSMSGIPQQQRTANNEGTRVNPIQSVKTDISNHLNEKDLQQNEQPKREKVEEVVKGLNEFLQPSHTSLKFKFHEKLHEYYVTIVDDNTNEVVKEIPAKKLLDTYAAMAERLGILVDRKI